MATNAIPRRRQAVPPTMTGPQQVFLAFLGGILLLMASTGIVAVKTGIHDALGGGSPRDSLIALLFGSAFASVLTGAVIATVPEVRRMRFESDLRAAYPEQPWMWRKAWAGSVVRETGREFHIFLLVIAIMWNAISLAVIGIVIRLASPKMLLLLIHPAAGFALFAIALRYVLRRRKYGRSRVRLQPFPIAPGVPFNGELLARMVEPPQSGYWFRLTCVNTTSTGSGRNRSTSKVVMWRAEQTVESGAARRSAEGTCVPFTFTIPADAWETDERFPRSSIDWRLEARAEVRGVDYGAKFDLPVFYPGPRTDGQTMASRKTLPWPGFRAVIEMARRRLRESARRPN